MIKYHVENIYTIRHEIEELLPLHYRDASTHKAVKKLAPDWERFRKLTEDDMCRTVTARDDNDHLIGYFITFIVPHIHFECTMAVNDAVFMHPDHRGKAVYHMFKYAIADIKATTDADILAVHMKVHLPFRKLLYKLGFDQTEENWELVL